MKCLLQRLRVVRNPPPKPSLYPPYLLTILFLFRLCTAQTATPKPCRQSGQYTLCEIPRDVPRPPFDVGDPVDRNYSSPSTILQEGLRSGRAPHAPQTRQPTSKFSAHIVGSPSKAHNSAVDFCMERAAENWKSDIQVTVKVNFSDLGNPLLLGTGQPTRNWIVNDFICPVALAEAVVKQELNGGSPGDSKYDILMTLNTRASWYIGVNASPPSGKYDLVTVCLHEVYHGLFLSGGNIGVSVNKLDLSYSAIFLRESVTGRFDSFMANQDGCNITAYKDNPGNLGTVLTGNNLWFVSESERIAKLYAPRPYTPGSSLYHLSEADYGSDGDNDLMTPAIGSNYGQHNPGPILLRMQALILDVGGKSGADDCEVVNAPTVDDASIEQDSGDGSDPGRGNSQGGGGWFSGTMRNIVIGAAVGAVVVVLVVGIVIRAVVVSRRKKKAQQRPKRRVQEQLNFVDGGNGGGIV